MHHLIIAGSGTMGASMAQIFASFDYKVTLYDIKAEALEAARERIAKNVAILTESGEFDAARGQRTLSNIDYTTDNNCFKSCDAVIENIVENLEIKRRFYAEISQLTPDDTVIASNTSGLSINAMAEAVRLPERFIGMHWFNPPHLILLVEIIRGDHTSDKTAQAIYDLCLAIGKKPVMVNKDVLGFAANRLQVALFREALALVDQGVVSPEGIDDVMKYGLGFRYACVGPMEIADLGGLDVWNHVSSYVAPDLCAENVMPASITERVERGELGVKTGRGFYDYSAGQGEELIKERDRKMIAIFNALYREE
ncbi:3-hydroxyacyl-CoA dehydrogenase family protein [bacterium]|nr:3-hydroxyacyl-CoA dehydrogenase family protein [bacterium]